MKLFNGYVLGTSGGGKSFDVKVRKADDFAFDEPRGRSAKRYNCCLVLKFDDNDE